MEQPITPLPTLAGGKWSESASTGAPATIEECRAVDMPPWYIDRCRAAYLASDFDSAADCRILGVTSPQHREGKTSVAIGIATAIAADTQERTLLLECDLERPSFHRYFGFNRGYGLSEWLYGAPTGVRMLQASPLNNLYVVPAGAPPTDPARLFYRLSESSLIEDMKPAFRNIVIDLPPMLDISYSALASKVADRILVVARYGQTQATDLQRVRYLLGAERLAGLVLNDTSYRTPGWLRRLF